MVVASAPPVASVAQGREEFWLATSPVQPDTADHSILQTKLSANAGTTYLD